MMRNILMLKSSYREQLHYSKDQNDDTIGIPEVQNLSSDFNILD